MDGMGGGLVWCGGPYWVMSSSGGYVLRIGI